MTQQESKPTVFVGSSTGKKPLASAIKTILEEDQTISAHLWKDVLHPPRTVIEGLVAVLDTHHFGVFVLGADDVLILRGGEQTSATRDNVILEVGLFLGRRGRDATFLIGPDTSFSASGATHIPSDLGGVLLGVYDTSELTPAHAVRSATDIAKDLIIKEWNRSVAAASSDAHARPASATMAIPESHAGSDVWLGAATAGALRRPVSPEWVRIDAPVVDEMRGWGCIVGIGPLEVSERTVTVQFANGRIESLALSQLYEARFKPR